MGIDGLKLALGPSGLAPGDRVRENSSAMTT